MAPADLVDLAPHARCADVKAILAGNAAAYAKLQSEYGDEPLVIAVGEGIEGGKFAMRLVGRRRRGRDQFRPRRQRARRRLQDRGPRCRGAWPGRAGKSLEGHAVDAGAAPQQASREEGQSPAAPQGEPERNVVAVVEFSGLKEWQEIRARLMQVTGIQGLEVNALSARTASITFDYAGSLGRLQKELDQDGFAFENRADAFVIHTR